MNKIKVSAAQLGILLCGALLHYPASGQPSVSVGISVPLPSVEIRAESDFYEPLAPQGEWLTVGSYGRCWRPARVARDWRPYCNGRWENTDAGWYWVSDEPWAWATYHYGRWDFTDQYGWYWVPQIQWAPAWVSWHEGGGYIGWAPLQPSVTISAGGYVGFNQSRIAPRAFVFVKQGQFLDPIRPTTVVVNNTTIINKTVAISNTRIVNNNVINGGPATTGIEKSSGRKLQAVPVRELRQKEEAVVAAKHPARAQANENKAPLRSEAVPREQKAIPAPATSQLEKPAATPRAPAPLTPTGRLSESEKAKPAPSQPEPRPEAIHPAVIQPSEQKAVPAPAPLTPTGRLSESEKAKPTPSQSEARPEANRPAVNQPSEQKADKRAPKQQTPVKAADKKAQRPVQEKAAPQENNSPGPAEKDRENKPKQ